MLQESREAFFLHMELEKAFKYYILHLKEGTRIKVPVLSSGRGGGSVGRLQGFPLAKMLFMFAY